MRDFSVCKTYLSHLRAEHIRIRQAIRGVRRELDAAQSANDPPRITQALLQLRQTLVHHFDEEDAGGCLDEAASYCPSLTRDVRAIQQQHVGLTHMLDLLIDRARNAGQRDVPPLVAAFNDYATLLQRHETAENRLLQRAFGTGEWPE